jgi:hypothetical protein
MAVKPTPGGSDGTYGDELNEFLDASLASDGTIKDGAVAVTQSQGDNSTKVATTEYADASAPDGDIPVTVDSEANPLEETHAYLTQSTGFVTAWAVEDSSPLTGYVGITDDPFGAGMLVAQTQGTTAGADPFISFFVANGKYFEIRITADNVFITWTPFVTGGGNPIDQD